MTFTFLHAADLHLDSPLRGLAARGVEARPFLSASRLALANLVEAAIARKVAFLVIAGDVFDGDWRDYSTGQVFAREMGRLARENIPVYMLRGNHDAGSVISKQLALPANVREFSTSGVETIRNEALKVALHGRGFGERHEQDDFSRDYPAAIPGWFNIGVLHTSLDGREGHGVYAPTRIEHLRRPGYDYWALGHIHAREIVSEEPWVVFPNLQGRHARETGPKGATLVRVENGRVAKLEALALDAARFDHIRLDLGEARDEDEFQAKARSAFGEAARAAEGRPLALRVTLAGASALHENVFAHRAQVEEDLQALASEAGDDVLIEKLVVATTSRRAAPASPALEGFYEILEDLAREPGFRAEIAETLSGLRAKAAAQACELAELGEPDETASKAIETALATLRASLDAGREERS